jgi:hypothetical protein
VDEVLHGGVANAGAVVRRGDHVLRPANRHSESVHRFLRALRAAGFDGVPEPVGIEGDRERLTFVPGDVAVVPFPDWFQADAVLTSVADLLRRFHEASAAFDPAGGDWSDAMADPAGGTVVVHNDVCPENVVVRDGEAVALIDFDFAAPGRPVHDLAQMVRMCGPVDDDVNAARLGWHPADRAARARLAADAYGLDATGRQDLLSSLDAAMASSGGFLRRQIEAGHVHFAAMWEEMGGQERFDRRRTWWTGARPAFERALA